MSQYVNQYNGQNGMGGMNGPPMGPPDGMMGDMGQSNMGPMGNPGYPSSAYNRPNNRSAMPNTQGWKSYSTPPPPPQARPTEGRWVDSFEDIRPQEVPMDGVMRFFPKGDCSCIYAKFWDNDGNLRSFRFLPEKEEPPMPPVYAMSPEVLERIASMEAKVTDLYNSLTGPTTGTVKAKKEET